MIPVSKGAKVELLENSAYRFLRGDLIRFGTEHLQRMRVAHHRFAIRANVEVLDEKKTVDASQQRLQV